MCAYAHHVPADAAAFLSAAAGHVTMNLAHEAIHTYYLTVSMGQDQGLVLLGSCSRTHREKSHVGWAVFLSGPSRRDMSISELLRLLANIFPHGYRIHVSVPLQSPQ